MKKLLILFFITVITYGATAQVKIGGTFRNGYTRGGSVHYVRPRVTVIAPYAYAPANRYYGYRNSFRYAPFYDPFYRPYNRQQRFQDKPTQLDLAIEDIKEDYEYQIETVKDDKNLSKDEKKQQIRDLKHLQENEISEAKKNYYKDKETNNDRS